MVADLAMQEAVPFSPGWPERKEAQQGQKHLLQLVTFDDTPKNVQRTASVQGSCSAHTRGSSCNCILRRSGMPSTSFTSRSLIRTSKSPGLGCLSRTCKGALPRVFEAWPKKDHGRQHVQLQQMLRQRTQAQAFLSMRQVENPFVCVPRPLGVSWNGCEQNLST